MPELAAWGHFTESQTCGRDAQPVGPASARTGRLERRAAPRPSPPAWSAAALGSDGGGSIRIPRACGLFGLKPQRGRVPLAPDDDHWHGADRLRPDRPHGARRRAAPRRARRRATASSRRPQRRAARAARRRLHQADAARQARPPSAARRSSETARAPARRSATTVRRARPALRPGPAGRCSCPRYAARRRRRTPQRLEAPDELEPRTRGLARLGPRGWAGARCARPAPPEAAARPHQRDLRRARRAPHAGHRGPAAAVGRYDGGRGAHLPRRRPVRLLHGGLEPHRPARRRAARRLRRRRPAAGGAARRRPGDEATLFALAAQLEQARPWAHRPPPVG